jgi:hypothetical protein
MGLAPLSASITLTAMTLMLAAGLVVTYHHLGSSDLALKDRERMLEAEHRTRIALSGFNSTNVTSQTINVTLYLDNVGSNGIDPGCVDLYVDGAWVERTSLGWDVLPAAFDAGLWNPSETLLLSARQDLPVGEHDALVVACSGARASGAFNASKCGDGRCDGGEYCFRDNSSCVVPICQTPFCAGGCLQSPIISDIDLGRCDSNYAGGSCLSAPCMCDAASRCCGLRLADCTGDGNCCPGFSCQSGNKCRAI